MWVDLINIIEICRELWVALPLLLRCGQRIVSGENPADETLLHAQVTDGEHVRSTETEHEEHIDCPLRCVSDRLGRQYGGSPGQYRGQL